MYSKIIKIAGIVRQERMWETKAIPDATLVSLPNALGMMMVFRPKGIAREQTAQVAKVSGIGNANITPRKSSGKAISRRMVTKYTLLMPRTSRKLNFAIVIPVSSIATGDIQLPAAEAAD